jgi:hypothetical protein
MASELSNYLANAILNYLDGDAMPSAPADVYVALFDGDPTATGSGGTEVTTTIRVAGRLAVTWGAVSSRACSNSADIDFGLAAGAADVTHIAIFDASSAGNMLMYSPVDNVRNILAGDPVVIPTGDLSANFN